MYAYIHTSVHTYMHVCMHVCKHAHIHAYVHTSIPPCIYVKSRSYDYVHMHICMYTVLHMQENMLAKNQTSKQTRRDEQVDTVTPAMKARMLDAWSYTLASARTAPATMAAMRLTGNTATSVGSCKGRMPTSSGMLTTRTLFSVTLKFVTMGRTTTRHHNDHDDVGDNDDDDDDDNLSRSNLVNVRSQIDNLCLFESLDAT